MIGPLDEVFDHGSGTSYLSIAPTFQGVSFLASPALSRCHLIIRHSESLNNATLPSTLADTGRQMVWCNCNVSVGAQG